MNEIKKKDTGMLIGDKYLLSIKEAGEYFNIGTKKMRRLAEDNLGSFSVFCGNRYLIIRTKFEEFICKTSTIQFSFICRKQLIFSAI